jgi:hypothetical protein
MRAVRAVAREGSLAAQLSGATPTRAAIRCRVLLHPKRKRTHLGEVCEDLYGSAGRLHARFASAWAGLQKSLADVLTDYPKVTIDFDVVMTTDGQLLHCTCLMPSPRTSLSTTRATDARRPSVRHPIRFALPKRWDKSRHPALRFSTVNRLGVRCHHCPVRFRGAQICTGWHARCFGSGREEWHSRLECPHPNNRLRLHGGTGALHTLNHYALDNCRSNGHGV